MGNRTWEIECFQLLKEEVAAVCRASHPVCDIPIREWKGKEIESLQEDLTLKVRGRISEKWFYTHIKAHKNDKLPRIDMLNLLSRYAGYKGWDDFLKARKPETVPDTGILMQAEPKSAPADVLPSGSVQLAVQTGATDGSRTVREAGFTPPKIEKPETVPEKSANKASGRRGRSVFSRLLPWAFAGLTLLALAGFLIAGQLKKEHYRFCFIDATTRTAIPSESMLRLEVIQEGETPLGLGGDQDGCIELPIRKGTFRFIVSARYYHPDTIIRKLDGTSGEEVITLEPDDWALMLHYFSKSRVEDWKKRRGQLSNIIADDAQIFQVAPDGKTGMELYNKIEFINKLSIPVGSLREIEILETIYNDQKKIRVLRFIQQ